MFCKIINPIAFFILILNAAYSQITFEKIYGGDLIDRAYSVEQTTDGGYITAGTSQISNSGYADISIVKFDQSGNIQWSKEIDRRYIDIANKIILTNDGNYIISGLCGDTITGTSRSGFLIKLNQSGDTIWCKEFEYFDLNKVDVVQSNDGSYALLGSTNSLGAGWSDIIFTKVDQNGNEIVTKTYGGIENDHGNSINITNDEGFIITGTVDTFNSYMQNLYIVRTNAHGDTLWTLNHGESGSSEDGQDGKQLLGGDFIATGHTITESGYNVYLVRVSSSGNFLWSKTYESVESQFGKSIIQTLDGGFAIAGYGWNNNMDVYLIKTDEIGDTIWTRWYGGNYTDYVYSLQQTPDNGFIISGCYQLTETPQIDAYLIKTDSNGMINPVYIHEMLDINEITVVPNPLIEKGNIKIAIKKAGSLNISLYNLSGLKIKTIFNENVQPGELSLNFDVRNLPSGVYYINLRNEEKTILKKIVKI